MDNTYNSQFLLHITKIGSLLLVVTFTILFSIVPLVQRQFKVNPWIINCSQSLYCGMFLSLTFLNFFPQALKTFKANFDTQAYEIFPIPFIVSLAAYTLMLIMNKILVFSRDFRSKKKHVIKDFFRSSITYNDDLVPQKLHFGQWDVRKYRSGGGGHAVEPFEEEVRNQEASNNGPQKMKILTNTQFGRRTIDFDEQDDQAEYIEYKQKKNRLSNPLRTFGPPRKHKNSDMIVSYWDSLNVQDSHMSSNDSDLTPQKYKYQSYSKSNLILTLLCFQGFIEGVALGLQNTYCSIMFMTMATCAHKFTESSMLCMTLILHKVRYTKLVYSLIIYGFIEPLGIAVGWMLENDSLTEGFILSFVAGNMLYITCSEGIVELFEMGDKSKSIKFFQFMIIIFGVLLNCVLWFANRELSADTRWK